MDKLETVSVSSEDEYSSDVSSISGLTGYEDEINEIKKLIELSTTGDPKIKSTTKKSNDSKEIFHYQLRIDNLNSALQNALKLNEKYKNHLLALQRRQDVKYYENMQKFLKKNAMLEEEVKSCNAQINNILIRNKIVQGDENIPKVEQELHEMKEENRQLKNSINILRSEMDRWQNENNLSQVLLIETKDRLKMVEAEVNLKKNCVEVLKNKITEQHIELHEIKRKLGISQSNVVVITNELEHTKKSVEWYKQRLQSSRTDRNKITDELLAIKGDLIDKNSKLEYYKEEVIDWKSKFREMLLTDKVEKENLKDVIEELQNKVTTKSNEPQIKVQQSQTKDKNYYEQEILDVTQEMSKVKCAVEEQAALFDKISRENAELLARNTTMQKLLNDKELKFEILEAAKKEQINKLHDLNSSLVLKENELLESNSAISKLKIVLDRTLEEKNKVSEAILVIRNDFAKFLEMYNKLKMELSDKNKILLHEQQDKQELFMQNNWNVCEIEEFRQKEKEIMSKVESLHSDKLNLTKEVTQLKSNVDKLSAELVALKEQNKNFENKIEAVTKENDILKHNEHKVDFYKNSIKSLNLKLEEKKNAETTYYNKMYVSVFEILCQNLTSLLKNRVDNSPIRIFCKNNNLYTIDMKLDEILLKLDDSIAEIGKYFVNFNKEIQILKSKCAKYECDSKEINDCNKDGCEKFENNTEKLEAAMKVKELAMKEVQKRCEKNNSTLLRKIKEHMRERNKAEKHAKYLQNLYNAIVNELSETKLQINQRDFEIESHKNMLEIKHCTVEKLQNSIANLEVQIESKRTEVTSLKDTLNKAESKLLALQSNLDIVAADLKAKESTILMFKQQINNLHINIDKMQSEREEYVNSRNELVIELQLQNTKTEKFQQQAENEQKKFNDLSIELSNLEATHLKHLNKINTIKLESHTLQEKNEDLLEEIKILNCTLHQKDEELSSLKSKKHNKEIDKTYKENHLERLLLKSEQDSYDLHGNLKMLNSEKYFLQRLNNDLKVALNTTMRQNQILKEKVSSQMRDMEFRSLPEFMSNLPGPSMYDDAHIQDLLQQTNNLGTTKPFTNLHNCLKSLKQEMASLQQQLAEKKYICSSL